MEYKGDIYYINQVLNGNSNSFGHLVEKHKNQAYNLAFRICGNREEAEELTQDSFLKAYRSLDTFRLKSRFSTWLYRIVYNTAVSHMRSKKKNVLSLEDFPAEAIDFIGNSASDEEAEKEYRDALVNFALQKISEEERGLITLFYYECMSTDEISDIAGINKSAVKVKLFRARQKMLEVIKKTETRNLLSYDQSGKK